MNHQTSTVPQVIPQVAYQSPQAPTQLTTESPFVDSGLAVPVFSPGDDPIACLNKAMAFLTAVASSRGDKGKIILPKRQRNATWYKEKAMLAEAQEARQILDEEQLAFLADLEILAGQAQIIIPHNAAFQTEDLDTYDSDCDDLSNAQAGTRLCVPNDATLREALLTEAHSSPFSIHLGSTKMYHDLKQYFWWSGMKRHVATFVSRCLICQQVKIEHQEASGLLQPLDIPVWKWEEISMDFVIGLKFSTAFHHQTDGQTERTIQTLEDMLRSCALEWTRNWDDYICLVEFAYNNSWHASIKCAPFEMLYGRKCRALICWDQVGEGVIKGPEMIKVTNEKVAVAKEKLKEARTRDHVFLKVSPARGVRRFGIKGKLSPCFIGPFEILDWVEAMATACYTQNRSIIRIHHGKTPYELLHNKLPDLSFLHVFGALCYPTNDSENLGKLQPKADIGIFISYAPTKKAFRIYNRCTRRIVETIHVDFDELTTMASEQSSSGPALNEMAPVTMSSGLVQKPSSSTPYVPPSRND
nr:retrotransposon protein, putative, Ty3-gypsy subclass [Tanacetum cinerariifolium]